VEIIFRDETQFLGIYRDGELHLTPGIDRESVAFGLFRALMSTMTPDVGVNVTWGNVWAPLPANQGGP
jgi:hypothetical protein